MEEPADALLPAFPDEPLAVPELASCDEPVADDDVVVPEPLAEEPLDGWALLETVEDALVDEVALLLVLGANELPVVALAVPEDAEDVDAALDVSAPDAWLLLLLLLRADEPAALLLPPVTLDEFPDDTVPPEELLVAAPSVPLPAHPTVMTRGKTSNKRCTCVFTGPSKASSSHSAFAPGAKSEACATCMALNHQRTAHQPVGCPEDGGVAVPGDASHVGRAHAQP